MNNIIVAAALIALLGLWVIFVPKPPRAAPVDYHAVIDLPNCGYITPIRVDVVNRTASYIHRISWKVRTSDGDEANDNHLTERLLANETRTSCVKAPASFSIASPTTVEVDETWYR